MDPRVKPGGDEAGLRRPNHPMEACPGRIELTYIDSTVVIQQL